MNSRTLSVAVAVLLLCAGTRLYSEVSSPEATVLATLQAMKAANQDMIDRQEKTLKALDELRAQAEQLKTFGKRT